MKISRRKFIAAGGLAAAAAVLAGSVPGQGYKGAGLSAPASTDALSRLTWDSFYPYQTTDFTFTGGDGRITVLRLASMADLSPAGFKPKTKGEECFTLVFTGKAKQTLSDGTYTVGHFALGQFDLFITVGGRSGKSNRYVALVNRITG
jgi:hypothetical protein